MTEQLADPVLLARRGRGEVVVPNRRHHGNSAAGAAVDWAGLAAELGYSDQAHLVRDSTATVGVPPTAYAG